jgi:hypothetical protein
MAMSGQATTVSIADDADERVIRRMLHPLLARNPSRLLRSARIDP